MNDFFVFPLFSLTAVDYGFTSSSGDLLSSGETDPELFPVVDVSGD